MKRSTMTIVGLSILLVTSNLYWAYRLLDAGVSYTYLQSSYDDARGTALQALALLPEVARPDATPQKLIAAANRIQPNAEAFEKEGFVWVGEIGLRFDSSGKLVEARPATEPF